LPFTDHFYHQDNAFVKHFWGRVPLIHGAALFEFKKEGPIQELMHGLKYRNKKDIGILSGAFAGRRMMESAYFQPVDIIIPIPISKLKKNKRKYNQSQLIAEGIQKVTGYPIADDVLIKIRDTGSQTSRSRAARLENVAGSFTIKNKLKIIDRHVLLVDDVITTGATLESCALLLIEEGVKSVSCLTLAIARN
jgi:ComF family protein